MTDQKTLAPLRTATEAALTGEETEPPDGTLPTTPETIGTELIRVFNEGADPRLFFDTLKAAGELETAFPELAALVGQPAGPPGTHEEGDTYEHTMQVLTAMRNIAGNDPAALAAALAHDFGKGTTPADDLPSHPKHASRGAEISQSFGARLGLDSEIVQHMVTGARQHMRLHTVTEMRSAKVVRFVYDLQDAAVSVETMCNLGEADTKGREVDDGRDPKNFARGLIEGRLQAAERAIGDVPPERVVEEHGFDPDEEPDKFENVLHQKRVERFRGSDPA